MNDRTNTQTTRAPQEGGTPKTPIESQPTGRGGFGLLILTSVLMALIIAPVVPGGISGTAAAAPGKGYKRIVALTPFAANSMALMGAFPKAIGQTLGGDRRYASALRSTPILAMKHPKGPNPEQLIRRRPDLILSSPQWSMGRKFMTEVVRRNAKGKRGRVVNADPDSVIGAYAKVRQISKLVDRRARGKRLVRQMKKSVRKQSKRLTTGPTVMVVLGVGGEPLVFTSRSWAGDIVRRAGGQLLTGGASLKTNYVRISHEAILREDPEVIIAIPHDEPDKITEEMRAELRDKWIGTKAATDKRVYFSTDNSLLQAGTDIGATIRKVRRYLGN